LVTKLCFNLVLVLNTIWTKVGSIEMVTMLTVHYRASRLACHNNDSPVNSMDSTGSIENQFYFTADWSGRVKAWSRTNYIGKLETMNGCVHSSNRYCKSIYKQTLED